MGIAPARSNAAPVAVRQTLRPGGDAADARGTAVFKVRGRGGRRSGTLLVSGARLERRSFYDVTVDSVRVGSLETSRRGTGRARFRTTPRGDDDQHDRGVLLPALGTIVFVLLVPGTVVVAVAVPYLLTHWRGAALLACALPLFVAFTLRFVVEGRGTPAPVAPTQRLVMGGPLRWVRNPGYVAVVALLVGQALVFGSTLLLAYAGALAACFHLFIVLYEEPTLRRQFGAEYEAYCRRVPRWGRRG